MPTDRWIGRLPLSLLLTAIFVWALAPDLSAEKVSTGDVKTDNVIVEMQGKLKPVKTCRAQVTTRLLLDGEVYVIRDSASYRVPGRLRLERSISDEMRQTILSDGSLLWIHDHSENMVSRVNLSRVYKATDLEADGDQPDPTRPFRGIEWETIRYLKAEALGSELCRAFEASPKMTSVFAELPVVPVKVRILVNQDDGLARQVQYLGPGGEEILTYRFEQVEVNPELDKKVFEFVVPARALVMDATEETIELLKTASGGSGQDR